MFFEKAQLQLRARGILIGDALNCKPKIRVNQNVKHAVRQKLSQYERPWVFVCPRSDSYNVRNVPDWIWEIVAEKTKGTKFWVGRHPAPKNFVDLNCRHFDNVIEYISVADLMISVDTGPMHVAAALGIPMVTISQSSSPDLHLNDQNDFISVAPKLDCLNCQQNLCPKSEHMPPCQQIDPELVANWANARLRYRFGDDVSAIIPIYQPDVNTLNRTLECVLPQVQEVIVTGEGYSRIPPGALQHPKIKYVQKFVNQIGYGRNVNFGARHSNGKFLLLLNDDVFLDPEAVSRMKFEMDSEVGMVGHLLRYPDGTIYHAGKMREPGARGWGHIDYRHRDPTIKQAVDMENINGASVLVRREAFYGIDGFDERFKIYAEDDAFCLAMRRAGWRIRYTPHATGVHLEHQSTAKLGNIQELVGQANATFNAIWGKYLDHNLHRIPGSFDYE
jgi:GT2 family glycosyltransferase